MYDDTVREAQSDQRDLVSRLEKLARKLNAVYIDADNVFDMEVVVGEMERHIKLAENQLED